MIAILQEWNEYYEDAQNNEFLRNESKSVFELDPSVTQSGDIGKEIATITEWLVYHSRQKFKI